MQLIDAEHSGHEFFEHDGRYFLRVECGTTAVFDLTVELTPDEVTTYLSDGIDVVRTLAGRIRFDPSSYSDRHLPEIPS